MAIYNLPAGFENRMSLSSSYSQDTRLRQVEFGDGYIQRTALGVNSRRRRMDVAWNNITSLEYQTLYSLLDFYHKYGHAIALNAGNLLFTPGNFMIETIDVQVADNEHFTLTAKLTEVFDL